MALRSLPRPTPGHGSIKTRDRLAGKNGVAGLAGGTSLNLADSLGHMVRKIDIGSGAVSTISARS